MIREPRPGTHPDMVEFYRNLIAGSPIVNGQLLSVDAAATTATQQARHGLGRVYRGAFVVTCDANVVLRALPPEGQAEPGTFLYFALSSAMAASARVWCF